MVVGVCTIDLHLPGTGSLKGKRQILLSLKDRLKKTYNVSIAEVDGNDLWQRAVLGVACVSNDGRHARQMLDAVVSEIRANPSVELIEHHVEPLCPMTGHKRTDRVGDQIGMEIADIL